MDKNETKYFFLIFLHLKFSSKQGEHDEDDAGGQAEQQSALERIRDQQLRLQVDREQLLRNNAIIEEVFFKNFFLLFS